MTSYIKSEMRSAINRWHNPSCRIDQVLAGSQILTLHRIWLHQLDLSLAECMTYCRANQGQ